jgi:hypothetical protein
MHRHTRALGFFIAVAATAFLLATGCDATLQTAPSTTPAKNVQSSSGPTLSGYVDTGASKSVH